MKMRVYCNGIIVSDQMVGAENPCFEDDEGLSQVDVRLGRLRITINDDGLIVIEGAPTVIENGEDQMVIRDVITKGNK